MCHFDIRRADLCSSSTDVRYTSACTCIPRRGTRKALSQCTLRERDGLIVPRNCGKHGKTRYTGAGATIHDSRNGEMFLKSGVLPTELS